MGLIRYRLLLKNNNHHGMRRYEIYTFFMRKVKTKKLNLHISFLIGEYLRRGCLKR